MQLFNAWSLTDFIRDRSHTAAPESVTRSHTLVYINDAPDAAGQAALNALYVLHFSRKTIKWRRLQVLSPQAMSLPLVSQVLNAGRRCAHQMCRYARLKTQQLTGEVVVKFNVSQSVTRLYHTPLLAANTPGQNCQNVHVVRGVWTVVTHWMVWWTRHLGNPRLTTSNNSCMCTYAQKTS